MSSLSDNELDNLSLSLRHLRDVLLEVLETTAQTRCTWWPRSL